MRLIDADALREQLQNLAYDDWNQGVSTSWADAYREIADMVEDAPTIEPERKTGRITYTHFSEELWGQSAICISCGCKWQIAEEGEYNFCPNCGADMRKTKDATF